MIAALSSFRQEQDADSLNTTFYSQYTPELRGQDNGVHGTALKALQLSSKEREATFRKANPSKKGSGVGRWNMTLLDGFGHNVHKKLMQIHLATSDLYDGALGCLMQVLTFVLALRGDDALNLSFHDLAVLIGEERDVQLFTRMGSEEKEPTLGMIMVDDFNSNGKKDYVCMLHSVDGHICPFGMGFGLYFFTRYTILGDAPPDLFPAPTSSSTSSSSTSSTASSSWKDLRLCAGRQHNRLTPFTSVRQPMYANAVKKANRQAGINVKGVTKLNRRSAAILGQVNGASTRDTLKQLCHTEHNTANVHYANLPSILIIRSMAQWAKTGIPTHPRQGLAHELRRGRFKSLLYAAFPIIEPLRNTFNNMSDALKEKHYHEQLFLQMFIESAASFIESMAEIRILDPNRNKPFAQIKQFNYPPFNQSTFDEFVDALKETYGEIKSQSQIVASANAYLDTGEVRSGFELLSREMIAAQTTRDRASTQRIASLENTVNTLVGSINQLVTAVGGGQIPPNMPIPNIVPLVGQPQVGVPVPLPVPIIPIPTIDSKDPNTWPPKSDWIRPNTLQLKNVTTLEDIYEMWYVGWLTYPALKHIVDKYNSSFYKHMNWEPKDKANFRRMKYIASFLPTMTEVTKMQDALYECVGADTEEEKIASHNWASIRKYHDFLKKQNKPANWEETSAMMSACRNKGVKRKRDEHEHDQRDQRDELASSSSSSSISTSSSSSSSDLTSTTNTTNAFGSTNSGSSGSI